jgi:hypothetical protein
MKRIASISTALCLSVLCSCTATLPPRDVPPNILALTEPAPRPSKAIDELRTEEDESQFVIEADATMAKDEAQFARLRAYLTQKPRTWWQKMFGRPAGGGP